MISTCQARVVQCDEALRRQTEAHTAQTRSLLGNIERLGAELQASRTRIATLEMEMKNSLAEAVL